jgi:hypothetical protein
MLVSGCSVRACLNAGMDVKCLANSCLRRQRWVVGPLVGGDHRNASLAI